MQYIIGNISDIQIKADSINAAVAPTFLDGITTHLFEVSQSYLDSTQAAIPIVEGYENYYNPNDIANAVELPKGWNDQGWKTHTQNKRCFVSDLIIAKIATDQTYSGIIGYIHGSTVEIDKSPVDGIYCYMNYIFPEHEAILNYFGILIENR